MRLHEDWATLALVRLGQVAATLTDEGPITEAERALRIQGIELLCHAWATWTVAAMNGKTYDMLAIEEQLESSGWGWPT